MFEVLIFYLAAFNSAFVGDDLISSFVAVFIFSRNQIH